MVSAVIDIQDLSQVVPGRKAVLLFWAPWHEGSSGPMTQVLNLLASSNNDNDDDDDKQSSIVFGRVHAEEATSISTKYNVTVVPTFIFLNETGQEVVDRIQGGEDISKVTQAVQQLLHVPPAQQPSSSNEEPNEDDNKGKDDNELSKRLDRLIRSNEVMLFMKGTPDTPRCGFSRQVVEILQNENIAFASFDILTDETVRQGLKVHSNWPTYPQIYVNGELIGGLDILKEMQQQGSSSLAEQLGITTTTISATTTQQPQEPLEDRLRKLIHRHRIMLFMKGLPSAPQCGFSRQIVDILEQEQVAFDAFDILTNEEIRQGLKEFSDWPTYPQLYVEGELIGGLDIVQEMHADGSLHDILQPTTKNNKAD